MGHFIFTLSSLLLSKGRGSRGVKMPQQKDIVKIAIQMPGAYPQLIQLDQVIRTYTCMHAHTQKFQTPSLLKSKYQ